MQARSRQRTGGAMPDKAKDPLPEAPDLSEAAEAIARGRELVKQARRLAEASVASGSFHRRRLRLIHEKNRSTTHRRGWTAKPIWSGGLRTISTVMIVAVARSTPDSRGQRRELPSRSLAIQRRHETAHVAA